MGDEEFLQSASAIKEALRRLKVHQGDHRFRNQESPAMAFNMEIIVDHLILIEEELVKTLTKLGKVS